MAESAGHMQAPRIYAGGLVMRRDDELIRRLMLDFEASDDALLTHIYDDVEDADEHEREYWHLRLLADSGLLEQTSPSVFRMTSAGHDFCAAIKDDTIWRKTREASTAVAGVSLSMMKDIGLAYLRARLIEVGVPLG